MIRRKAKGTRTDKLKCVETNRWESAVVGMEYFSPKQYGGIHGTVYRQYFNTTLPADLTAGNNVSKVLDYIIYAHNGADRFTNIGWSSDGTSQTKIGLLGTSGYGNLVMYDAGSFAGNIVNGWIDYAK